MTYLWFSNAQAQTAAAVFDRMFPADDRDPGAIGIGVVDFVDRALTDADASLQDVYRLGFQQLDDSARERHSAAFAQCPPAAQDDLLRDLERGTLAGPEGGTQQAFFEILLTHLREGLFADPVHGGNRDHAGWRFLRHPGAWLDYSLEESLSPEPAFKDGQMRGVADLSADPGVIARPEFTNPDWDEDSPVDVILVGVGLVGGLVAPPLAAAGMRVLGLEAGPWRQSGEYRPDELTYSCGLRAQFGQKFRSEWPSWRPDDDADVAPAAASIGHMVNGIGGSALHYGAMLRRYHPHHFAERTRLTKLGGEGAIPEGCTIADWPVGYEDLEPYYDELERLVGVSGGPGNPFVPRRTGFPMPPMRPFRLGEAFKSASLKLGYHPYMCPIGANSEPYHGRPGIRYNTFELTLGDNVDGKWHPGLDCVPEALATGNFELQTGARVTRVLTDSAGRASGVEYLDAHGRRHRRAAQTVILSAYALENVRLMLLSADERHPNGLGNNGDQLGRHTMSRMFCGVYGEVPGENYNLHTGATYQNMMFEDLESDGFNSLEHGFIGGATLGSEQGGLPVGISRTPLPPDVPRWGLAYKTHLRRWQSYAFVRIQHAALPYETHRIELDPHRRDTSGAGLPVLRITHRLEENEERQHAFMVSRAEEILTQMGATRTWAGPAYTGVLSSHELGGARMGDDPADSVVDDSLEVHDTPGLFVFSGAVFPSGCSINPTLTIMALAVRAAEKLIARHGA